MLGGVFGDIATTPDNFLYASGDGFDAVNIVWSIEVNGQEIVTLLTAILRATFWLGKNLYLVCDGHPLPSDSHTSSFALTRRMISSVKSVVVQLPPRSGVLTPRWTASKTAS